MGFQEIRRLRTRYERLTRTDSPNEKVVIARPRRRCLVNKMTGRLKGIRISRSRKLNWKAFSIVILPRMISGIYAEIVNRMMKMDMGIYPSIVFSCQWGLPVLSHSTSTVSNIF